MQEVVQFSSTASATIFSPTPLHIHALFEADALDISGSPFTVDAPSSGGSNNFDGFYEQSDTQLLPTSHEPPINKRKFPKRRCLLNPQSMCDIFSFSSFDVYSFLRAFWVEARLRPPTGTSTGRAPLPLPLHGGFILGSHARHARVLTNIMGFTATSYVVLKNGDLI